LLVLVVELPLAQFEVAVTQLLRIFDFFVDNHLLQHRDGSLLFAHVVIVLENGQLDLGQLILYSVFLVLVLTKDILLFNKINL
jgi:hypothetical protein